MNRRKLIAAAKAAEAAFKGNSQKWRIYCRLVASLINGRDLKNIHFAQMRILSYTKRVSEIRDIIGVYGLTIVATKVDDSNIFIYTIEAAR